MTLGSFILTYNRPTALEGSIRVVLGQTQPPDHLLVVDNGSGNAAREVVESFDGAVSYVSTGANLGSAGGVAFGMRRLFEEGFDWIHSVDDDNPPLTDDTLERMRALMGRIGDDVGAVGASGTRWDWRRGQHIRLEDNELQGDLDVDTIGGNQHLIVRRDIIESVGTPEPEFFFGFYDPLYCLRLRQAGFRIVISGDLARDYRRLAGRMNLAPTRRVRPQDPLHAIWRRYYVTRNYIYRMRNTFNRPDLARREVGRAIGRSATSWLSGPRYGARYTSLQFRGVLDGYRSRLGRRVEPTPKP
jgi:rhamnopyranosyl-N-acetylglucosaminyl-diphospho-decaprenol beta-1,3/1,4-galactofuranosyltransferase